MNSDILTTLDDPRAADILMDLILLADVVEKGKAMPIGTISERQKGKAKIFFRKFGSNDWRQVKRGKKGWVIVEGGAKTKSPGARVMPEKAPQRIALYKDRIKSLADVASARIAESKDFSEISAAMKDVSHSFANSRNALKNFGEAGEKAWQDVQAGAKRQLDKLLKSHALLLDAKGEEADPNIKASYDRILSLFKKKPKEDKPADPKTDEKAKEMVDKLSKVKDAKDPKQVMEALRGSADFASIGGVLSGLASLAKALAVLAIPLLLVTALGMIL